MEVVGFVTGAALATYALARVRAARLPPPEYDAADIRVSELHIHPVKGMRGHPVQTAVVDALGLVHDRRFVVARELEGSPALLFTTQRQNPLMATLTATVEEEQDGQVGILRLSVDRKHNSNGPDAPASLAVRVCWELEGEATAAMGIALRCVKVWRTTTPAIDQGDAVAAWLSAVLGEPGLRLLAMCDRHSAHRRPISPSWLPSDTAESGVSTVTSFADGYPVLLCTQESMAELNRCIAARCGGDAAAGALPAGYPFPITRFRPNVVVTGAPGPWAEDSWQRMTVGEGGLTFRGVKRCDRCSVPTTDQVSGAKPPGPTAAAEPIATLRRIHASALGPEEGTFFGMNCIPEGVQDGATWRISVGDKVRVLRTAVIGPE